MALESVVEGAGYGCGCHLEVCKQEALIRALARRPGEHVDLNSQPDACITSASCRALGRTPRLKSL